jgi:hypothetical protein
MFWDILCGKFIVLGLREAVPWCIAPELLKFAPRIKNAELRDNIYRSIRCQALA